jgi:hypothetical protein
MSRDANVEIVRRAIENPAEPGVFADDVVWRCPRTGFRLPRAGGLPLGVPGQAHGADRRELRRGGEIGRAHV